MEDQKKPEETNDIEDIEMGDEETQGEEKPKVNNYMKDIKPPEHKTEHVQEASEDVDPSDEAPEKTPENTPEWVKARESEMSAPVHHGRPMPQVKKPILKNVGTKIAARKKAIIGVLAGIGGLLLILFIAAFVLVAQTGKGPSAIATMFKISQLSFVNGLIAFIHLIFVAIAFVIFIFIMMGLFKSAMAKKEEKDVKKRGMRMSLIAGALLFALLIGWVFAYVYLDGKRVIAEEEVLPPIVTEPKDLVGLTAPITIRFDASNVPYDSSKYKILSYKWDFGDGETGTNQIVTHNYSDKGIDGRFDVVLTVTRIDKKTGDEFEDVYTAIVTIANQALSAIFEADPQEGEAPLKVEFDASESIDPDGTIERYEWDLDGDGEFDDAEGETAEYEFEKIGRYTVSLRVTSTTGEFAISEKEIIVGEKEIPEAVITITGEPESFELNTQYIFKAEDSSSPNGKIESYEWDFGDGTRLETTKTVAHTFKTAGVYEVILKVVDEKDKEGEITMEINVGAPQGIPVAVISTSPPKSGSTVSGTVPLAISFDASGSTDSDDNIVDYEWDFNNDGIADAFGPTTAHTFTEAGSYTVKLKVIDSDGNSGEASVNVSVEAQGIVANISTDIVEGTVPLTVAFDGSGSTYDGGQITSYKWDFGDGTSPKLGAAQISHKYTAIGTYTATLTVIGADNTTAETDVFITVREIPLSACFVSVFEEGPAPLETTFDPGCSSGTISSYFWDFGDGTTSTAVKPSHVYENPGAYTVNLEISDAENTVSQAALTINVTE